MMDLSFMRAKSAGAFVPPEDSPDLLLSSTTVATRWGIEQVGTFTLVNCPPGCTVRLKETPGAVGDETGFAVVNG